MIHWQTVKEFFGFGDSTVPNKPTAPPPAPTAGHDHSPPPAPVRETSAPDLQVVAPVTTRQPQISLKKAQARKARTNPRNYYRRGGKYYSLMDDSLIEDILLLYVLTDLFSDNDVPDYNEVEMARAVEPEITEEPVEDLLDIDVSETPVVEAETYSAPEPTYSEPEPVRESSSFSSGSSYSSGSSDYGSSDSGGGGGSDD